MLKNTRDPQLLTQMLLSLLATSATMAGVSLALVGITNYEIVSTKIASISDDIFLFSGVGFVVVCLLIFMAIRHVETARISTLARSIDTLFLASLALMLAGGYTNVYAAI